MSAASRARAVQRGSPGATIEAAGATSLVGRVAAGGKDGLNPAPIMHERALVRVGGCSDKGGETQVRLNDVSTVQRQTSTWEGEKSVSATLSLSLWDLTQ